MLIEWDEMLSASNAADIIGVTTQTMARYEKEGKLIPAHRTAGGHRRYTLRQIEEFIAAHRSRRVAGHEA